MTFLAAISARFHAVSAEDDWAAVAAERELIDGIARPNVDSLKSAKSSEWTWANATMLTS